MWWNPTQPATCKSPQQRSPSPPLTSTSFSCLSHLTLFPVVILKCDPRTRFHQRCTNNAFWILSYFMFYVTAFPCALIRAAVTARPCPRVLLQAGEERLHHGQIHGETFRQEEVRRPDVAAPHVVRRGESPRHLLPHPGLRRGSRPHGAHTAGQRTRQCTIPFTFTALSDSSPVTLKHHLISWVVWSILRQFVIETYINKVKLNFRNKGRRRFI